MNIEAIIQFIQEKMTLEYNQKSFAEKAGIGINTLSRFYKEKNINISTLNRIINALGYKLEIKFVEVRND